MSHTAGVIRQTEVELGDVEMGVTPVREMPDTSRLSRMLSEMQDELENNRREKAEANKERAEEQLFYRTKLKDFEAALASRGGDREGVLRDPSERHRASHLNQKRIENYAHFTGDDASVNFDTWWKELESHLVVAGYSDYERTSCLTNKLAKTAREYLRLEFVTGHRRERFFIKTTLYH